MPEKLNIILIIIVFVFLFSFSMYDVIKRTKKYNKLLKQNKDSEIKSDKDVEIESGTQFLSGIISALKSIFK